MNLTQEKALLHIAGKLETSELTLDKWQQLANEHPYFAPIQFFLASKLKRQDNALSASQLVKTNLYFTNAHWFQFQLQDALLKGDDTRITSSAKKEPIKSAFRETMAVPTVESVKDLMRNIDHSGDSTEEPAPDEYLEENNAPVTTETDNKIASVLSNQLADFKRPVEPDAKLDIDAGKERLHTIDYFASQGIKIDLSTIPQDKLTTHLRKFTDWLKQMKNTQETPTDLGTNPEMEKAVAETARNSNENREVLTEAMAEVLAQQGQIDKAIQLYIKLSFLNPEKSSYFAAQVEQLKGI